MKTHLSSYGGGINLRWRLVMELVYVLVTWMLLQFHLWSRQGNLSIYWVCSDVILALSWWLYIIQIRFWFIQLHNIVLMVSCITFQFSSYKVEGWQIIGFISYTLIILLQWRTWAAVLELRWQVECQAEKTKRRKLPIPASLPLSVMSNEVWFKNYLKSFIPIKDIFHCWVTVSLRPMYRSLSLVPCKCFISRCIWNVGKQTSENSKRSRCPG